MYFCSGSFVLNVEIHVFNSQKLFFLHCFLSTLSLILISESTFRFDFRCGAHAFLCLCVFAYVLPSVQDAFPLPFLFSQQTLTYTSKPISNVSSSVMIPLPTTGRMRQSLLYAHKVYCGTSNANYNLFTHLPSLLIRNSLRAAHGSSISVSLVSNIV